MKLSTAILAGGKNSRAGGQNKSFLLYKNQPIIERILNQLTSFDEILISVGANKKHYEHMPYKLVEDEVAGLGPLSGIHACLKNSRNEHLFVCATDMPNIKKELVEYIASFITKDHDCFVLESAEGLQPLCSVYTKRIIPITERVLSEQNYSLRRIFDNSRVKYIPLDYKKFDESIVANINYLCELDSI